MGLYGIYLLFFLGIALFIYYIYIMVVGKSLARLVGSKDRYIWNGLLNISAPGMPFAKRRNTLFLDHDNLVISNRNVVSILHELKRTESLEDAIVIPFQRIVAFDYKRSVADWNVVIRFILGLWNRLIKKNDFHLSVRYLDADRTIKQFLFKANSMDINDFEATFADFDNQIYSGKVRYEAEHGMPDELVARPAIEPEPVVEDLNPTVAIRGGEIPEVVIPVRELTEELPILTIDEAPVKVTPEEPAEELIAEEVAIEELTEPLPFATPTDEVVQEPEFIAPQIDEVPANEPIIEDHVLEPIVEQPVIEPIVEEAVAEEDVTEEITPTRQPRKWFEEDFMPRRAAKEPVVDDQSDKTVMIDRQELRDRGIVFERPDRRPVQEEEVVFDRPARRRFEDFEPMEPVAEEAPQEIPDRPRRKPKPEV